MVMKQELDEELCRKYPRIFAKRHASMQETLMCWGFECGDGWYNIINNLCANIQNHLDWNTKQRETAIAYNQMISDAKAGNWDRFNEWYKGTKVDSREQYKERTLNGEFQNVSDLIPQVVAVQIKEKFGTLRFYYDGGDSTISGMVRMAETMSGTTCEECGAPGETHGGGWIRTLCETHEAEYQKRRQENEN
jgi:hypothetical protein